MGEPTEKAKDQLSRGEDKKFLCGVAVNVYQNSGDPNSNWAWFEKQKAAHINIDFRLTTGDMRGIRACPGYNTEPTIGCHLEKLGPSVIQEGFQIGKASDFWHLYEDDIAKAASLGCNSMRISIEWSRLYPKKGQLDQSAVDTYNRMFDCMERHNIEASCTLHWFVHPHWFDLNGAFANADNIDVYVDWACTAFRLFGTRSKMWSTFNEPGVASMCGYISGNHPPGKLLHFRTAGCVLLNMLRAHTAAYTALRELPGGKDVMIGLIHNVFWTEPKGYGPLYAHVRWSVRMANRIWGNETVLNYLKSGVFHHKPPLTPAMHWQHPDGRPGCDFFGLNNYSRAVVNWNMTPCNKLPEPVLDMGYPSYPPALYRAISYVSSLGVPVYVTENGMPSGEEDGGRSDWIQGYLGLTEKAVQDGYDVRGFFFWTLIDNYEWNFAWMLKFGIFAWDEKKDPDYRHFRPSCAGLKDWYARLPEDLGKVMQRRAIKPPQERRELETKREDEYLKSLGWSDEQVRKLSSYDPSPMTVGATSKYTVELAEQ